MFLSVGHEKNVIYSKLVNNPFKHSLIETKRRKLVNNPFKHSLIEDSVYPVRPDGLDHRTTRHTVHRKLELVVDSSYRKEMAKFQIATVNICQKLICIP